MSDENADGKSGTGSSPDRSTSTVSRSEESTCDGDNLAGDSKSKQSKRILKKRSSKVSNTDQYHASNLKFVRIYYGVAVGEFRWKVTSVSLRVQDDGSKESKVMKVDKRRKNKAQIVPEEGLNNGLNGMDKGNINTENVAIDSNGNKVNNVLNWISNVTNLIDGT